MKRHATLVPISREHRKVLMLAQLLKKNAPYYKGLPVDWKGKQEYAATQYKNFLKRHMKREEERLFPAMEGISVQIDGIIHELKNEHEAIHVYFSQVLKGKIHEEQADDLGHMLEKHVRKEERIFFQQIQAILNEEQFKKLERILYNDIL